MTDNTPVGPDDGGPRSAAVSARRLAWAVLVPVAIATVTGMVLLWPRDTSAETPEEEGSTRVSGQVVAVHQTECPPAEDGSVVPDDVMTTRCGTVTVRLTDGPDAGETITTRIPSGPGAITVEPGDHITLLYMEDSFSGEPYSINDHRRSLELLGLGVIFALAVVAFGRWRGLASLIGLGITFAILLLFVVPAILDGRSPMLIAIVGSTAIMLTVLYLAHGFTLTTTVAVAGTLVSLTLTAIMATVATAAIHLSGITDESSLYLTVTNTQINMRGLLMASIVIGSLGVLDDVTITQSMTVSELAQANPAYRFRQLYRGASRVGRAHISSVINTIVLAYAGASMPLMLLFALSGTPVVELLTTQYISQELVRSAVGTLGLIAAVPITTAIAAAIAHASALRPSQLAETGPHPVAGESGISGESDAAGESDASGPSRRAGRSPRPAKANLPKEPWMAYLDDPDRESGTFP